MLLKRSPAGDVFASARRRSRPGAAGCGGCRSRATTRGRRAAAGSSAGAGAAAARAAAAARGAPAAASAARGGSTIDRRRRAPSTRPTCVAGGACVPANACHKGMFVCIEGGAMSCMELTDLQANGTGCDTDKVCHNGSCDRCVAGMACDVTGKPCRVGSIVCTTGAPVCTETNNKPNGTGCGTGHGLPGGDVRDLPGGRRVHADEQVPQRHAGLHGRGAVVHGHQHQRRRRHVLRHGHGLQRHGRLRRLRRRARPASSPGKPCRRGTIACNTGTPVCIESGNAAQRQRLRHRHGLPGGRLRDLLGGYDLRPREPVPRRHHRLLADDRLHRHGQRARERRQLRHRQGLQRRHLRVVRGGLELPADQRLQDGHDVVRDRLAGLHRVGQPRRTARPAAPTWCATPAPASTCSAGGACTPTNPCHTGTLTCTTGAPTCTDTGQNQADGTALRHEPGVQDRQLRLVHRGSGLPADQPVQERRDVVRDRRDRSAPRPPTRAPGTLCGAGQSCANGVLTLPAMCNAAGTCAAATMQCPSGCNTAGTDCATCPTGQTSCPSGLPGSRRSDVTTAAVRQRLPVARPGQRHPGAA